MKKYIIGYLTDEDDYCKVWLTASSKEEAVSEFKREYWDWKEIVSVRED